MSQNRNSISKQVLAWTAVFALVLSILPYSVADQSSNEYFASWSHELSDTDGDNQDDTILFTFDIDTNVTDYVEVEVDMEVRDDNGNYVGSDGDNYEIYWTDNDTFEMEWFVDDCDDYDDDCEGPFDFHFRLYEVIDGYWYYEDNFTESDVYLYETTIVPEGVVQVDHAVFADDDDGLNNDIMFIAHMEDYDVSNVSIELERKVGTQWVDVGDEETDDEGGAAFKNMSSGEYRWFAEYEDEDIDKGHTFVFYSTTSDNNIGHLGVIDDFDGDDDYDDFIFARWSNGSDESINDGVYVELFYEDNNTLYDEDGGDGDDFVVVFYDVEEGNYTFNLYNENSSGDLMQTGWMHSYGSLNTNNDEWFEDWNYETNDEDNNGIDDVITIEYNPDTTCNCTVEIIVEMQVYNETGYFVHYDDYDYEINGTDEVWFETDEWSPYEDGNYTFEFFLYDENWNDEDSFNFSAYLECGSGSYSCNYDEWFEHWDYETNDTNNNGVDDTIVVGYNPDTECNCSMDVYVETYVINADNGDYVYYDYYDHEINGTEDDWFETDDWSPYEDGNYTFYFRLYDENWNDEDNFNFTEYLECVEDCDANEWFESSDYETMDTDSDNLDDTIEVSFNPDTDCDCDVDIYVELAVFYNSSGNWVDYEGDGYTINSTEEDWFTLSWTSHNSTSYDFEVRLYDNNSYEDSFKIYDVYLYETSGAGGPGDDDEYFDWIDAYTYDNDGDGYNDTAELDYDADTTCECWVNITFEVEIFDNTTGQPVDDYEDTYEIYHDDDDYEYVDWSPEYNGSFDFYVNLYDEDGNLEDEEQYLDIELHVRSEGSNSTGDEWFDYWDYNVDSYTIDIGYDPDTDCYCEVRVWAYIDVYQNQSKIDTISDDYYIFYDDSDWFTQDWTADEEGVYDFRVVLFDGENGPDNYEDDFWISDVYLSSDGGNGEGIAHFADITDFEGDGHINDFIGAVEGSDGAYFEIYDANWDFVDGNYSEDFWFSENLDEGWYYHRINVDETGNQSYQEGRFYSYGYSSVNNSDIINVHQAVLQDNDEDGDPDLDCEGGPCDDAYFAANIGDWDNGVQDVTIDIERYDEDNGYWDDYATTYTNESGHAAVFDNPCGEYRWEAYYDGNYIDEGNYTVWAYCDDNEEEPRAWFDQLYYTVTDEDGDNSEDSVTVDYIIATDCDCEMDLLLILDIFYENEMIDTFEEHFTLPANENMEITFKWANDHAEGNITFVSVLEYLVDGDKEGEIILQEENSETFYLDALNDEPEFFIEDVIGRDNAYEGIPLELEVILANVGNEDLVVDWEMGDGNVHQGYNVGHVYEDDGWYEILVHAYSDNQYENASFEIYVNNRAPEFDEFYLVKEINEGEKWTPNVKYIDVPMDMDDITVTWQIMHIGSTSPDVILKGSFVEYTFADDGEFLILIEINDDDGGSTVVQKQLIVKNVAPIWGDENEFVFPLKGEQGVAMNFLVFATDPGNDTITYTFDFGDGTTKFSTPTGNASHKFASGDTYMVIVCATDEDGGESCTEPFPVSVDLLEQVEDGGLPGFGFLGVISALGAITLLRRRTH